VLLSHDLVAPRLEAGADLAAPRAVLEDLRPPGPGLNRRDVPPGLVVAGTVSMMERVEDAQPGSARSIENPQHVRNALVRLGDSLDAVKGLPPSEMKSLYGSITRSPVICLS